MAEAQHQVIATTNSHVGPLVRTETLVSVSAHPLDNFRFVRLRRAVPHGQLRTSILLLPSLGVPFSLYEQRDASGIPGTSIAEFFALRGYDVYGYSPRYDGIPAGSCEAGVVDCSIMGDWNLQSMLDDIAFIRNEIETLRPAQAVVTGGVSLGGILAVAVANGTPDAFDGIIPWEGMLRTPDAAVQALNQGYCAGLEAQLAAGILFDAVGGNVLRELARQSWINPNGVSATPLFPPTFTNHQALVAALSTPTPSPAGMPVPGYIAMNGSLAEDRLFFASEERLFENTARFANYAPTTLVRDISCSLAGVDDSYVGNLAAYTAPILAIGGGLGFGPYMQDQLDLTSSTDATLLLEPELAHIDHFMSPRHRRFVERPILRWLRRLFP